VVGVDQRARPTRVVRVGRLRPHRASTRQWDPEPGGWDRLAAVMHNEHRTALDLRHAELQPEGLINTGVAHLTGTAAFELTDAARAELKRFLEAGGTLVVDAAGGSAAFADSAEKELSALAAAFGPDQVKALGRALPPDHAVYTSPGPKIDRFGYRRHARKALAGGANMPRLKGFDVDGRPAVFFSREDMSAGLVGHDVDGILGYDPATATAIMRNIILLHADGPR
jgi:hypothetical protein